jgi:ribulose-5-phosphate 4-epimerase/fuculose-1-phosphate aldolase
MISVIFPSKGRPEYLIKSIKSLIETCKDINNIEILIALDNAGNIAYDIVGIKGHGVVAIDTSPWRAFEHIERLEHICQIVLASGKYE